MSTTSKPALGESIVVKFGGGIEGDATGQVTEHLYGGDVRMKLDADFWDKLSRRWHRKDSHIIVHAKEIVSPAP